MTPEKGSAMRQSLSSLIPSDWLERKAREVKYLRRERKVDPWALVWTLVLGFVVGRSRSFTALRRCYETETGTLLVASAFYDRFTPALTRLMREVLLYVLERMSEPTRALRGRLKAFADVVAMDTTILRLQDSLAAVFPASRNDKIASAAKLNVVMSVVGQGPRTIRVTSENAKEERKIRIGPWVEKRLLLFDLGYYSGRLFKTIDKHGGYFITRMKKNMNPLLTKVNAVAGGEAPATEQPLLSALARFKGTALDIQARIRFKRRAYAGHERWDEAEFRVVALWHPEQKEWRCYITNAPESLLSTEEIGRVYGLRWEIEIIFRQLKRDFRLEDLPTKKAHIVETFIYSSILTLVASRRLLFLLRQRCPDEAERMPHERWTRIITTVATKLLSLVLNPRSASLKEIAAIWDYLSKEAIDPNRKRRGGLLVRVEMKDWIEPIPQMLYERNRFITSDLNH